MASKGAQPAERKVIPRQSQQPSLGAQEDFVEELTDAVNVGRSCQLLTAQAPGDFSESMSSLYLLVMPMDVNPTPSQRRDVTVDSFGS